MKSKRLIILGTRGVPALHGGFETFAEFLSLHMVSKDWTVTVYCQEEGSCEIFESEWNGVKRIHISVPHSGPLGTIVFDLKSVFHSRHQEGVFLTLGYNTAIFNLFTRMWGKDNVINMDGIEWKRRKWGVVARTWFWVNERIGCWVGNHLIADHPKIEAHLATRVSSEKITMIPYGGKQISEADEEALSAFGVKKDHYALVIARPEPENSILEIVQAFSQLQIKGKLVVLGNFHPESNTYHRHVLESANDQVVFPGAIYDSETVESLRCFCKFYVHGHQVGGTNPSLVEALGAGNAILAHDNEFNRWVAGNSAIYFDGLESLISAFENMFSKDKLVSSCRESARQKFKKQFQWGNILNQYEQLLEERL